ncbi:MAG: STN domain-containing protein [Sphingopyxis sp.]|uniref:STN domain-containing protein n=1 Tax=Sphingopyxis sp. TaxID=1908224 RepID=UPI001A27D907|nr:STN domain-containing protein [Sphingopyxis sp.]MBJ7498653.1 STN domain-containing protein [Sphingopyxis sp.]
MAGPVAARERDWGVTAGQPLADALRQFGKRNGYDVIVAEGLVEGKRAGPVQEARTAYEALMQMLEGSGLVPRFTRPDAIILESASREAPADMSLDEIDVLTSAFRASNDEYRWYGEKLLGASLALLRRSSELGTRSYDFTLYVWLSADGRITGLDGFGAGSNGEALVIARRLLDGMTVGSPPPANMPQPVGLRIVAQ